MKMLLLAAAILNQAVPAPASATTCTATLALDRNRAWTFDVYFQGDNPGSEPRLAYRFPWAANDREKIRGYCRQALRETPGCASVDPGSCEN